MTSSAQSTKSLQRLNSLDLWRLCDELSVVQAALLIAGEDPTDHGQERYIESWPADNQPSGYRAARAALMHAVIGKRLPARIVYHARDREWSPGGEYGYEVPQSSERLVKDALLRTGNGNEAEEFEPSPDLIVDTDPDLSRTTIMVDALKVWLRGRGLRQGFFFPEREEEANYLNHEHPRYAPKLAAAVRAWQAAEGRDAGKSPKTVLAKWLRENAPQYGLTDSDGKTNETGIEECAKVANWEPRGGAPKTPDSFNINGVGSSNSIKIPAPKAMPPLSARSNSPTSSRYDASDMDDDIPF